MGLGGVNDPVQNTNTHNRTLIGHKGFKRINPRTDRFDVQHFDHVEFWCGDATNASRRFGYGLGMTLVAHSDQGTGNMHFASYVMKSGEVTFAFTAPYSTTTPKEGSTPPVDWYDQNQAYEFLKRHGMAVRALALRVADAEAAFLASLQNGARAVQPATRLVDSATGTSCTVAEVQLYGDVVLRYMSGDFKGPYFPGYVSVESGPTVTYGIQRLDHAVGNVPDLIQAVDYVAGFSGFHEFAEFVAEDVGTVDSGLNSMVLASNNEMVLLPLNEPTHGTRRKSQIQTYLEQNEGPGLQHLALKTDDIFTSLREMRARSFTGGFEFMPQPSDTYYRGLPDKIGPALTPEQYKACEELGILVDKDDQGILLQIFTKPLGDRPTVFIEIIQRLCQVDIGDGDATESVTLERLAKPAAADVLPKTTSLDIGGCGGFGKGNFSELFKSIEVYETHLGIN